MDNVSRCIGMNMWLIECYCQFRTFLTFRSVTLGAVPFKTFESFCDIARNYDKFVYAMFCVYSYRFRHIFQMLIDNYPGLLQSSLSHSHLLIDIKLLLYLDINCNKNHYCFFKYHAFFWLGLNSEQVWTVTANSYECDLPVYHLI